MSTAMISTPAATAPAAAAAAAAPAAAGAAAVPGIATPYVSASLYVGDLHPDVHEANLHELFGTVGPVASVRVCRDNATRRSLGYGYVNYHSYADAERALENLNYTPLKDRPVRIMWCQRDPTQRRSPSNNIFIKNLAKTIDLRTLSDTFSQFGNILSCKIALDEKGNSKGFGFIHYEDKDSAGKAIKEVNGMLLEGKKVFVSEFQGRTDREKTFDGPRPFYNVYIKDIDLKTTDEEFREAFTKFGEVTSISLPRKEDGTLRGFGFCNYKKAESAQAAVDGASAIKFNGNAPFVGPHQTKTERARFLKQRDEEYKAQHPQGSLGNLYIKNLDEMIDDEKLRQAFASYGNITSAKVMRDENARSRGFGFVCFSTPEDATRAATEMNGRMLASKPLYVALHQRKEVRRAQLEAQYAQRAYRQRLEAQLPGAMFAAQQPMFYPPGARPTFFGMVPRGPQGWQPRPAGPAGQPFVPNPGMAGGVGAQQRPRPANAAKPRQGSPMVPVSAQGGAAGANGAPLKQGGAPIQGQQNPRFQQQGQQQGQPQQRLKYAGNVRNRDQAATGAAPAQAAYPGQYIPPQEPLTANALAAASPADQKNMLGERLYPLVYTLQGERAGKITGMLLEMDNSELLILLESPAELSAKVNEAVAVLEAHSTQ